MDSQVELTAVTPSRRDSTYLAADRDEHASWMQCQDTLGEEPRQEFSLPPVDGGKDAWLFLAGCFMIEALVWGFPLSFGVFQEYYSTHEPFASHPSGIAAIGTTASGIMYLLGLVTFTVLGKYPRLQRPCSMIGLPIIALGIVLASFANTVWQLIVTQGVIYAIGGSIMYCPVIIFLDEWFVARKGLAYGIMWAGTGFSGAIIPFVMDVGLERFGFRTMLRAWAVAIVVLTVPLMYYVRPRIPRSATATSLRRFDFSYFKSPIFWTYQGCNIINGLGYFIPGTYMPTYAEAIHSPRIGGTLALALFNAASVLGNMAVGHLVDRTSHVSNIMLVVAVVSMLNIFIFWGLSLNLPMLLVFAVIYGMSAGGFSTMWSGMMKEIQKKFINTNTGILFGTFAAGRGIGAVVSGPLSEALLKTHTWQGSGGFGYGTGFGTLIVFTGTTAAAGSIAYGVRRIGWI